MAFEIENGVLRKYIPEPGETKIIVPEGVSDIAYDAFQNYADNVIIVLPDSFHYAECEYEEPEYEYAEAYIRSAFHFGRVAPNGRYNGELWDWQDKGWYSENKISKIILFGTELDIEAIYNAAFKENYVCSEEAEEEYEYTDDYFDDYEDTEENEMEFNNFACAVWSDIHLMINREFYCDVVPSAVVNEIAFEMFSHRSDDEECAEYVSSHFIKFLDFLINTEKINNKNQIFHKVLYDDTFMTKDNAEQLKPEIDKFIDMAIENKEHEIQEILEEYKQQHFD